MFGIKESILQALQEKKIFIGLHMLCRYLNGKGYIRYGCNAGYPEDDKSGNARINPCPILCKDSKIKISKVRYWCNKLFKKELLYMEKRLFYDSMNPFSHPYPHKTDLFMIIALNKEVYQQFINKNTLEKFVK